MSSLPSSWAFTSVVVEWTSNKVVSIIVGPCVFGLGCLFSIVVTWSMEIPYHSIPACCPGGSTMEQEQIMFLFASYYLNATVMAVWIAG
jgi:hypothetical protein